MTYLFQRNDLCLYYPLPSSSLAQPSRYTTIGMVSFIVQIYPFDLGQTREVLVKRLIRIQEQTRLLYGNLRTAIEEEISDRQQYLLEPALSLPLVVGQHMLSSEAAYTSFLGSGRSHDSGASGLNEQEVSDTPADSPLTIRIRINEEPLTAHNLTTIISALTELHTKCWLIAKGQFPELIEYTQTRSSRFDEEAPLVITKLAYNSPGLIEFNPDPEKVAKALQTGIDAVTQTPTRLKGAKLENQAKELDILLKEQESQSALAYKEQARQIGHEQAELEKQMAQLEIERKQLALEKERLELQEQRLELEKKRVDYALETANKMIAILSPNADPGTIALLARTLLSPLLQLGNGKGLELALSGPQKETSQIEDDS